MELGSRSAFAVVLLVGIVGTGIAVRLINAAGYSLLGSAVWVLGYGTTVFVLWYGWVRPIDLSGQTGSPAEPADDAEPTDGE